MVWTTTPWTLPSNQFAAVHPDLEYSVVVDRTHDGQTQKLIVASALVETIAGKVEAGAARSRRRFTGSELIGLRYVPPFDYLLSNSYGNEQGHA